MKILCQSGYFIVREDSPGEVAKFNSKFKMDLTLIDDYYTFSFLKNAKNYSVKLAPYLNLIGTKTYEGRPWEILKENGFVYDFNLRVLRLISTITDRVDLESLSFPCMSNSLVLPGTFTRELKRISSYLCTIDFDFYTFYYSDIVYV